MTSELLSDLAHVFKLEAEVEQGNVKADGGEAMRLWCISVELEIMARDKRREELENTILGDGEWP